MVSLISEPSTIGLIFLKVVWTDLRCNHVTKKHWVLWVLQKKLVFFLGAQRNPKIPQIPTSRSSHSTFERKVLLWGSCFLGGASVWHNNDLVSWLDTTSRSTRSRKSQRFVVRIGLLQEISNRTVPERTPKKPEYLIALPTYISGSVGIRSHSIFWWNFSKHDVHPWNLTWNLKRSPWKRRFLLETIIFRFHVEFRGCTSKPISEWGGLHVTARSWYLCFWEPQVSTRPARVLHRSPECHSNLRMLYMDFIVWKQTMCLWCLWWAYQSFVGITTYCTLRVQHVFFCKWCNFHSWFLL